MLQFLKWGKRYLRAIFWSPGYKKWYNRLDFRLADYHYYHMYRGHERLHRGIVDEIAKTHRGARVLEVACGAGWNAENFVKKGFDYYGLDVSETAISVALNRLPAARFLNLGIMDAAILRDDSFDIVYSSAMLEHIGCHLDAIGEMVRLAKKSLYIEFFEGLSDSPEDHIDFHAYTDREVSGEEKDALGRKIVLQDHRATSQKGWYWNRYSKARLRQWLETRQLRYEFLDATNRTFIDRQTILHVTKAA